VFDEVDAGIGGHTARAVGERLRELAAGRQALDEQRRAHDASQRAQLLALLEVADAFDRILVAARANEDGVARQTKIWLGNFRAVRRLLGTVLADAGVVALESLGLEFDPHTHRAVETVADPSRPDGSIADERQRGYAWRDEILRKAEVVVVNNAARRDAAPVAGASAINEAGEGDGSWGGS